MNATRPAQVGWLLDADMFAHYRDELISAIRDLGHEVRLVDAPSPPYRWDDVGLSYGRTFPADSCVVVHGDIELVSRIRDERRWTPGSFGALADFYWSSYVCRCSEFLLNEDYAMLPFGELARRKEFLFETFGRDGRVFVRPDSPAKLFTGQIAAHDTFAADLEFMGFYDFPPSSLVVVSSPKRLTAEWRFVVVEGQVVAGCQYKDGEQFELRPDCDDGARSLAQAIADTGFNPAPVWVMDVCRTHAGDYRLLEIGVFGCSDLYACNKADIVAAVSETAIREWEKAQAGGEE